MNKLNNLLIKNKIINSVTIEDSKITVNDRDLNVIDLINIYRIREKCYDNKNIKDLLDKLIQFSSKSNSMVKIVKIRGSVNKNLFVDSDFTEVIAILNIDEGNG